MAKEVPPKLEHHLRRLPKTKNAAQKAIQAGKAKETAKSDAAEAHLLTKTTTTKTGSIKEKNPVAVLETVKAS